MTVDRFLLVMMASAPNSALPTILIVVALVASLAAFGRSTVPRAERLPWTRWTAKDLIANVVVGCRRFIELNERNRRRPPGSHFHR